MTRSECLNLAKKTVCQDRNDQYGEPEEKRLRLQPALVAWCLSMVQKVVSR